MLTTQQAGSRLACKTKKAVGICAYGCMRNSSFFVNHIQFTTEKLPQFYSSLYIDLLKKSIKNAEKL